MSLLRIVETDGQTDEQMYVNRIITLEPLLGLSKIAAFFDILRKVLKIKIDTSHLTPKSDT